MISLFHHLNPVIKISASRAVIDADTVLENAVIFTHEGKVTEVLPAESATKLKADKRLNLTGLTVHPGFVNAHCHLELSHLHGKLKPQSEFVDWVYALVKKRSKASPRTIDAGIKNGLSRLLSTGVTCVGDVTSTGSVTPHIEKAGIRAVIFHETLGYKTASAGVKLRELVDRVERTPGSELVTHGVSPHAIYSTSANLIRGAAEYAAMRRKPMAIHICETPEENLFAKKGIGAMRELLWRLGAYEFGRHPKMAPIAAVEELGALKNALLIHFNYPTRGDITRAKKAGARVVVCPNSNVWFGRKFAHPLPMLLEKGVPAGIGTDSLASNNDLDIAAEARTLHQRFPDMPFKEIFRMATSGGAAALGLPQDYGTLRPGAPFDAVAVETGDGRGHNLPREIMGQGRVVRRVWVAGSLRYRNGKGDW